MFSRKHDSEAALGVGISEPLIRRARALAPQDTPVPMMPISMVDTAFKTVSSARRVTRDGISSGGSHRPGRPA
ncbi:hypothetical protein DF051_38865 [Burkholderia contaminans]|uniref:Uncharacterized protein n=1 Tax=Burkholderia contaminans TaxID=488447 RepID=A0A3N8NUY8_9BURK|nr:hypothetical protein DF051_38865 [Burkholderia contaminans]